MVWKITAQQKVNWDPSYISTALWLDAADATTITTVSGGVSQWSDKSGNSRHATQSASGSRPTVATASQNGKNGINFNGVNNYLGFASALLGATHSLFIVFKPTIKSAVGSVFGQWASGQTGRYVWSANQNANGLISSGRLNVFNSSTTQGAGSGSAADLAIDVGIANEVTLISSISTPGPEQWKLLKNGTEWESATITDVYSGTNSAIGSVNATSLINAYDGLIYEMINIGSYIDSWTRQRIEGYLAHKWGFTANLPADHPYIVNPPAP